MDGQDDDQVCLGLSLGQCSSEYQSPTEDACRVNKKRGPFLDLSIVCNPSGDQQKHESKKSCVSSCSMVEKDVTRFSKNKCSKRLMLASDQADLLEQTFEQNPNLNMVQRKALAEQLNVKPRQIEVWFQNRRARNKLKQTELDCKFLKLNCQRLSEENLRLEKELLALRGLFYNQVTKAKGIKACSSCEKTDSI